MRTPHKQRLRRTLTSASLTAALVLGSLVGIGAGTALADPTDTATGGETTTAEGSATAPASSNDQANAPVDTEGTATPAASPAAGGPAAQSDPAPAADPDPAPTALTLTMTRTDGGSEPVRVGDLLTFTVRVTNATDRTLTAYPRTSNLDNTVVSGSQGRCRWANLGAGLSYNCTSPQIRVTEEMAQAGSFTPYVIFDATADREGNSIIQAGIRVELPPIPVVSGSAPAPELVDGNGIILAVAGDGGYNCHRIPALTSTTNGWLLAAWDGRPDNCADAPQANSIVQRISKDGGKTWSPLTTVAAGHTGAGKYGYSDPSYVVDYQTGTVFMFFVKSFDQGLWNSTAGTDPNDRNVLHAAVMSSTDNGETWTEPQVITSSITPDVSWRTRFAARVKASKSATHRTQGA